MKPFVLIILDGWGIAPPGIGNAISQARLTHIPTYWNTYPHTTLEASGVSVGLPDNECGNTETGHINIGAGRVVLQDVLRIDEAIINKSFFQNDAFLGAIRHATSHHSNIHIMGLLSDTVVHASWKHLCTLLQLVRENYQGNVYLHLFTDGRDSLPKSAKALFSQLESHCREFPSVHIATIIGRYYAMDRDKRWERTEYAYTALTQSSQYTAPSVSDAIDYAYTRGETDEFIKPTILLDEQNHPYPRISDNDSVIFFNYRIDRPRQLTRAFVFPDFETRYQIFSFDPYTVKYHKKHIIEDSPPTRPFTRSVILKNILFVTMTQYEPDLPCIVAFPPLPVHKSLGSVLSYHSIRQLRMSESEKERFVTYYFNGMREEAYLGEDRVIIPSPHVATYDLAPQMSAAELSKTCTDRLSLGIYGFCVINFANPDMVGHTGNIPAAIRACETVDTCVDSVVSFVLSKGGSCAITADHGNVEEMLTPSGGIDTEHSNYPVPFILLSQKLIGHQIPMKQGKLADIAPSILACMGIQKPAEMTGESLISYTDIS